MKYLIARGEARPCKKRAHGHLATALIAILSLGVSCPPKETPPLTSKIDFPSGIGVPSPANGGFVVHVGNTPDTLDKRDIYYLGHSTESFSFELMTTRITESMTVRLSNWSGSVSERITVNSGETILTTGQIPGNIAVLTIATAATVVPPMVRVRSITVVNSGRLPMPTDAVADFSASLPIGPGTALDLNTPVDLVFNQLEPRIYFFTLNGVANRTLDFVLDGPGTVIVKGDDGYFPIDAVGANLVVEGAPSRADSFDTTSSAPSGFGTLVTSASMDRLLVKVTAGSEVGTPRREHFSRFSVNQAVDVIDLSARFAGNAPVDSTSEEGPVRTLSRHVVAGSQFLYQATGGRVRIGSLEVYTSTSAGGNTPSDLNIGIGVSGWDGVHTSPFGSIEVDAEWLGGHSIFSGWTLAHEMMHYRYNLIDEYVNAPAGLGPQDRELCPNSMMCGINQEELCWSRNHNPGLLPGPLSGMTSAWDTLAPQIGAPIPTSTPVQVLRSRDTSAVMIPHTLTVVD